jgi:hypothetical protein
MPKEDWAKKVGTIVIAIMIIGLAIVIYFVVSGQWGTKRFRGIEKFRGDQTERFEPALVASPVAEGRSLGV